MAVEFVLDRKKYKFSRPKLGEWFELEQIRSSIEDAAEAKDFDKLLVSVLSFVSAALKEEISDTIVWYELAEAYLLLIKENRPDQDFPLFRTRSRPKRRETNNDAWEYEGRIWYFWVHLFSKAYGWTLEQVSNLDVDDAIGLLQEILVEEQLDREWQWGLSEVAYAYDKATGKSRLQKLPRPEWMNIRATVHNAVKPRMIKVNRNMLPVGLIVHEKTEATNP